jgi:hypothetical protein
VGEGGSLTRSGSETDEGSVSADRDPSSALASRGHLLPQGEKGKVIHHFRDRLAAGSRVRIAAEVPRPQRFAEGALDGADDRGSGLLLPRCSSIIAPDQIMPIGLAMPCPAISGAEPCTASNTEGKLPSGLMLPDGAMPMVPVQAGPRSERMSPNRFEPTTTSNQSGCSTKFAVRMSMWYLSHFTFGKFFAIASTRSSQ